MDTDYLLLFLLLLSVLSLASADTFTVKITTERHINVVDSRFLSFTIDPKYLFSSSEKYNSKECICMAASLTPAYLRIAGPSTSHMTFHNTTIALSDLDHDVGKSELDVVEDSPKKVKLGRKLAVSLRQWKKFVHWSKSTGFDLVFALNNDERTLFGMWDPNTALKILTVAEKTRVGDMYWELGYECRNQSIEEYLNDLETLRVIVETFPPGRTGEWKVVGGDVTGCLQADSKSDFKDYVTLSNEMMDAVLLNGNSSSYELERLSENERLKLLRLLSHSQTPLWLTETTQRQYNELERAADWLTSLGYSAKNGFSIHYRELDEMEMYEPTLSFYMALLFKNLVGEKVLDLQMDSEQAILFAHCTSLRHKPVSGAVTLFGVNMNDEPARFSLKLAKREEGGDIMQFILGHDHNGNIVVNGHTMFNEGDIRPVVKRVRPYKTLLINLPSKTFGFWVLANTKVEACQGAKENHASKSIDVSEVDFDSEDIRVKRSTDDDSVDFSSIAHLSYDFDNNHDVRYISNEALGDRIVNINKDLDNVRKTFHNNGQRTKREADCNTVRTKLRRLRSKFKRHSKGESKSNGLVSKLLSIRRRNNTLSLAKIKQRNNKNSKRHSKRPKATAQLEDQEQINNSGLGVKETVDRKRRSVKEDEETIENDTDFDSTPKSKLWKALKDIQEKLDVLTPNDVKDDSKERILVKTEFSDDGATLKISESDAGLIRSTVNSVVNVLDDINEKLGKFKNIMNVLD